MSAVLSKDALTFGGGVKVYNTGSGSSSKSLEIDCPRNSYIMGMIFSTINNYGNWMVIFSYGMSSSLVVKELYKDRGESLESELTASWSGNKLTLSFPSNSNHMFGEYTLVAWN